MPIFCSNQIVIEKDKKRKWKWHKDKGWSVDTSSNTTSTNTVSNNVSTDKSTDKKSGGYMQGNLAK